MIRTRLHTQRAIDQIQQNLIGLQHDLVTNATQHRAMAAAQSPDVATLQTFVAACLTQYVRRIGWVRTMLDHATHGPLLRDAIGRVGWELTDITDVVEALDGAVTALDRASKATYADIVSACDGVLATVNAPDTLWPE